MVLRHQINIGMVLRHQIKRAPSVRLPRAVPRPCRCHKIRQVFRHQVKEHFSHRLATEMKMKQCQTLTMLVQNCQLWHPRRAPPRVGVSQVYLRSVSGLNQVYRRSISGLSQVSLRSTSGTSQVCLVRFCDPADATIFRKAFTRQIESIPLVSWIPCCKLI